MSLSEICRCCLEIKSDKEETFQLTSDWEDGTIIDLIQSLTKTLIKKNPELPQLICGSCLEKFLVAEEIIMKFLESDKILGELVEASTNTDCLDPPEQIPPDPEENPSKKFHPICYYCNGEFLTKKSLLEHVDESHRTKDSKFLCNFEECVFRCSTSYTMVHHLSAHHNPTDLTCQLCSKTYRDWQQFQQHQKSHRKRMELICDFCGVGIWSKSSLIRHFRRRHLGAPKNPKKPGKPQKPQPQIEKCRSCSKEFKNQQNMLRHLRTVHLKIRDFPCPFNGCGAAFCRKSILDNHYRSKHSLEKPFKCQVCEKKGKDVGFGDPSVLARHLWAVHEIRYSRKKK